MKQIIVNTSNNEYEIREETLEGKKFIIVPVVMMVEGVHHGSQGPIFHSIAELGKIPASWNGIPVTIDHPQIDDNYVSANSPEIIQKTIGKIFNTYVEDDKLKAEAWLDEEKMQQNAPALLAQIKNNELIEVSVGVFTEDEEVEGEWEGESYVAIAKYHRPDHLALLPGGVGACSADDGCGIRNNKSKKGGTLDEAKLIEVFKSLKEEGYSIDDVLNNLSEGYQERLDLLRRKIDSMDTESTVYFLQEAYDDHIVYEVRQRTGGTKLYKQTYSIEGNEVQLTGDAAEVQKKVEYVAVQSEKKYVFKRNNSKQKKENNMGKVKDCPACLEKVDELIANSNGVYTTDDKDWISELEEIQFNKLVSSVKAPKVVEKVVEKPVNALSAEDQAALEFGKTQLKEKRFNLVNGIIANTEEGIWKKEDLEKMENAVLESIYKSVKKEETVDYSLSANGRTIVNNVDNDGEALYFPGVEMEQSN